MRSENQDLPVGAIRSLQQERVVQIDARMRNPQDFVDLIITRKNGAAIRLGQVARVHDGAQELESLLVAYQQVNLTGTIDSIFACLMVSYFSQQKYEKCAETYKRYLKIIRGKPVYEDNDINIHTYYYLAQWLDSHRKQYLEKLKANHQRALAVHSIVEPSRSLQELVDYYKVPLVLD